MDLGLGNRTALVMGASRGIGRGIAHALVREGASVAFASRSREDLERAVAEADGPAAVFEADTHDLERLAELPRQVEAELGGIDILVTNTGGPPPGGALDHTLEEWDAAYRSLVLAPRVLVEAVIPGMRERGWGRIVNVGSSSTIEPLPHLALSNVHRMATVGFFKTLATEVAGDGITVNTIATGRFATDRVADASGSLEPAHEAARRDVPARRLGDPDEYGALVAFVVSERAAYLTGAVIPFDGGMLRSA